MAIAALFEGISQIFSATKDAKDLQPPALPPLPDPDKAKDDANKKLSNQRQALLLAGGQTDYTGGSGILKDKDVDKVALLGGG